MSGADSQVVVDPTITPPQAVEAKGDSTSTHQQIAHARLIADRAYGDPLEFSRELNYLLDVTEAKGDSTATHQQIAYARLIADRAYGDALEFSRELNYLLATSIDRGNQEFLGQVSDKIGCMTLRLSNMRSEYELNSSSAETLRAICKSQEDHNALDHVIQRFRLALVLLADIHGRLVLFGHSVTLTATQLATTRKVSYIGNTVGILAEKDSSGLTVWCMACTALAAAAAVLLIVKK